ncbi:MAG: hypothetical protein HY675_20585 [Chloroflexi bacterium]|nr:hypothetical protein [Chloroflexota bacterium]
MASAKEEAQREELIRILGDRLGRSETCAEIVDAYEEMLASLRDVTSSILGDDGTDVVLRRSIRLASRDFPLLEKIQARKGDVDFSGLREHVERVGCDPPEVFDALVQVTLAFFQVLWDLSGDVVAGLLLHRLDKPR